MTKKEIMDLVLTKVPEDQKEAFIEDIRAAKDPEERVAVLEKYGAKLTDEELERIKESGANIIPDEELDDAAGGCSCKSCYLPPV